MKKQERSETIQQLKQQGFVLVKGYRNLYINEAGKVYSLKHGRYLTPTAKNHIKLGKDCLNVPKLVLVAFKGEQYRSGQIHYIDLNSKNMSVENVKYSCLFPTNESITVNKANLMTAIRCYFEVIKSFTVENALTTRRYMQTIIERRGFIKLNEHKQHIEVYKTYINVSLFGLNSIAQTAKVHSLGVRDCSIIVNSFTNELVTDILQDLKKGILQELQYKPKKPTKPQQAKQANNYLRAIEQTTEPSRKRAQKAFK